MSNWYMHNYVSALSIQAEMLTGSAVTNVEEARRAAQELMKRGCKSVIITLGSQGCVVLQAQDSTSKHVPTTAVTAVDTTVSSLEEGNDTLMTGKLTGDVVPLNWFSLLDSNLLKRPVPLDWEAKPFILHRPLWPVFHHKGLDFLSQKCVWSCWVLKRMSHLRDVNCLFYVLDLIKAPVCLCNGLCS